MAEQPSKKYSTTSKVEKAESIARTYHMIFLGAVAYALTTYFTLSDRTIFLEDEIQLPILNLNVETGYFFLFTPFIIWGVYVYFNLALVRVLNEIDRLDPNEDYVPFWLITRSYVDKNLPESEKNERVDDPMAFQTPGFRILGRLTTSLLLWWMFPLFLLVNFVVQIKTHNDVNSVLLIFLNFVGMTTSWRFFLRFRKKRMFHRFQRIDTILILLFVSPILQFILVGIASEGNFTFFPDTSRKVFCLEVNNEVLIEQPKVDYPQLPWINLREKNLNGVNLRNSILKRGDLRGAQLRYADLRGADLSQCDLRDADLKNSLLSDVNFSNSDLSGMDLSCLDLSRANFQGAVLKDTDFSNSILTNTKFSGSSMDRTYFYGAILKGADLDSVRSYAEDLVPMLTNAWTLDNVDLAPRIRELCARRCPEIFNNFDDLHLPSLENMCQKPRQSRCFAPR